LHENLLVGSKRYAGAAAIASISIRKPTWVMRRQLGAWTRAAVAKEAGADGGIGGKVFGADEILNDLTQVLGPMPLFWSAERMFFQACSA